MVKQTKTLLIISIDRKVNNFLRTIINNIIGGRVKVYSQAMEDRAPKAVEPDAILSSGSFLLPRIKAMYPDKVIVAPKRLITGYNLEKVLMLPRGTRVLVVNHPRHATEDTIESLRNLGITHVEYIPFWSGARADLSALHVAVSPGMSHLCPANIRQVIDIGPRIISIYSFLQLLLALDLDLSYLENYATYYHNFLMESSRKLAAVLEHSELLRKYQEVILDQFEDALLSVNEKGEIDIANKAAARLFKKDSDVLLSMKASELMTGFNHTATLTTDLHKGRDASAIYDYGGKKILAQKIPVMSEKTPRHLYTFREIAKIQRLEKDVRLQLARKGYVTKYSFDDIWTRSGVMEELKQKAMSFAASEKNILITGESGTGKELFAHAIHSSSPRCDRPFVAVNFAGIPETLIESELFGYESGAFTGAQKGGKTGLFEQAHGGTIFLDEIGDAPLIVQSRLLRVLQEREIMKVGADRIIPVDVRIIAGTNADLHGAMAKKEFRKDLYYRLNTLPLEIPPLREHKEDILFVLHKYLKERYNVARELSNGATECLLRHGWPGNVRELINLAEYLFVSTLHSDSVGLEHLPRSLAESHQVPVIQEASLDDSQSTILKVLEKNGIPLDMACSILKALQDRNHLPSGRRTLIKELGRHNHSATEGGMKRYLRILKEIGLINVGITKQGSSLTPQGKALLEVLSANQSSPHAMS